MLSQCLLHSAYAASNLRRIATCTDKLHAILLKAQESLPFRVLELQMHRQFLYNKLRNEIEKEITECESQSKPIDEKISAFETKEQDESLALLQSQLKRLGEQKSELIIKLEQLNTKWSIILADGLKDIEIVNRVAQNARINPAMHEEASGFEFKIETL